MVAEEELTKTKAKLWRMLQDGAFHTKEELHTCLWDQLSDFPSTVKVHISQLRQDIRPEGFDVVSRCQDGLWGYILVRRINHKE